MSGDSYRDVDALTRSCLQKRRFCDEPTARAGAAIECQRQPDPEAAMWVYPCENCRGWHLTNKRRSPRWRVTARHLYPPPHTNPRQIIRTPQFGGFFATDGEAP